MKPRNIAIVILLLLIALNVWSQCTTTPVVEAVRNGDFEAGYLPGSTIGSPINSHTFTPGGPLDFSSSLSYSGQWKNPGNPCLWGMANQYGVGRAEKSTNNCDTRTMPVYGRYSQVYRDHTLGTNKGFAMFIDFNGGNAFKTAWAQTVDVFPSQLYYFSAWFAQYGGNQPAPNLRFRVITYNAGGTQLDNSVVGNAPVTGPQMNWQQFNGSYNTPANAATARIIIECKPTGGSNVDDFVIDDISFINGCQNIASDIAYQVEFPDDVASLCYNNGSYTAQIKKDDGTNLGGGKTIKWYKGSGTSQTEIPSFDNQQAPVLTSTGTYRACVVDPVNSGCTVNSTIVINKALNVSLPATEELCNPSQITLNTGRTEVGLVHSWNVPAGETASTTKNQTVTVGGNYEATVSLPSVSGCSQTASTNVTSKLPTPPSNMEYCIGDPVKLEVNDGKTYKWLEDDKSTVIGTENGSAVTWTGAPNTVGNYQVSLQSAETTPLSPALGSTSFPTYPVGTQAKNIAFTVTKPVVLKSFVVKAEAWVSGCNAVGTKTNGVFSINGPVTYSTTKQLNCGANTRVTVNWTLPPGNYILNTNKNLRRKPTFGTASIPGFVTVTSTNNRVYGSMTFAASKSCEPVLVDIEAKNCCTPATINTEPSDDTVCEGDNTSFSVTASGTGTITYQWQLKPSGGSWANISGANAKTANLSLSNVAAGDDGNRYRVRVTLDGNCHEWSQAAELSVNAVPSITNTVLNESICGGTSSTPIIITSDVMGSSFDWSSNTTGVTGATASGNGNIPGEQLSGNGTVTYSVIPEGPAPGNCVGSSTDFTVTVNETPSIPTLTSSPSTNSICEGATFIITASNTTSGSNFTWTKGTSSGTNNETINIASASSSDNGNYKALASKTYGALTCSSSNSTEFTLTINTTPSITAVNPAPQCGGSYDLSTAVTGAGTATLSYWDAATNGTNVTNPTSALGGNTYYIEATKNGCKSTREAVIVTIDESINLTAASPTAICMPNTIDITSSATPSAAVLSYFDAAGGSGGSGSIISPTGITSSGVYSVEATNGTCNAVADINVTVNALPSGSISIDKSIICNNGIDQATITLTGSGGTGPYTINYNKSGVPAQATNISSTEVITTTLAESFEIVGLSDSKGCNASNLGTPTSVTTTHIIDPTVSNKHFECKPSNPIGGAPGTYEYRMIITAAQGNVPTYNISGTFGGNAVNGTFSGSTWTSDWVVENAGDQFALNLTDGNNCNPVTITGDSVCSCPESASLAIANGSPSAVCVQGDITTTDITITFDDKGTGASSYSFDIYKDGLLVQSEATHDGSPYNFTNQTYGEYTIVGLTGTCSGASNTLTIDSLQSPIGAITAIDDTLCTGIDNANIQLTTLAGQSPLNFTINGTTTLVTTSTNITPSTGGIYNVSEIKDNNGCTSSDVSNLSVTIGEVTIPTGSITAPIAIALGTSGNHIFNPTSLAISASSPNTGYTGNWAITGTGTLGSAANSINNSLEGLSFDDQATITWTVSDIGNECPAETATLIVDRKNVTIALVNSDQLCNDFIGYTLQGNGLVPGETAQWRLSPLSNVTGLTITPVGGSNGKEATVSGYTMTPGVSNEKVIFEYEVTPIVGSPTTDTMSVTLYATPVSNPGNNETICGDSYQLKAPALSIGSGIWSDDQGGNLIYDDNTLNNATVSNLPSGNPGSPVDITFTLTVSNGVCTSVSNNVTITRSGDLSDPAPTVDKTEVCVLGGNVTLDGMNPVAANNETSSWTVTPTSNVSLSSTPNLAAASANFSAVGTYVFTYTIDNPTCPQTDKTITVEVQDTASITGIAYGDDCENQTVTASIQGEQNTTSIVWLAVTGASLIPSTGLTADFVLGSGQASSTIKATPSNLVCGAGTSIEVSNKVKLSPQIASTFNAGPTTVCSSSSTENYMVSSTEVPAPTSYSWTWDGTVKSATGTSLQLTASDFAGRSSAVLKVTPKNTCGTGIPTAITVAITNAQPITVSISSDKLLDQFCEGDAVTFSAFTNNGTIGGLVPNYRFLVNGAEQQAISTNSTFVSNTLSDNDNIQVEITGASGGCYTTTMATANVTMDGYKDPIASLILNDGGENGICENEGNITATLTNIQKGDVVGQWSRTSNSSTTTLLSGTTGQTSKTFTSGSEDGYYEVTVSNKVCPTTSLADADVQIWSHSTIIIPDSLLFNGSVSISLDKDEPNQIKEMPVFVFPSSGRDDIGIATWFVDQEDVLDVSNSTENLLVVDASGETNDAAIVTMYYQKGLCLDSVSVPVISSLPLDIPNAFSPNDDGINDRWIINGLNKYPSMQLTIFNRWGNKIFQTFSKYAADESWDGGNYPPGTYYYVIHIDDNTSGETKRTTLRGAVTITK